jgi:hypothetical protein
MAHHWRDRRSAKNSECALKKQAHHQQVLSSAHSLEIGHTLEVWAHGQYRQNGAASKNAEDSDTNRMLTETLKR